MERFLIPLQLGSIALFVFALIQAFVRNIRYFRKSTHRKAHRFSFAEILFCFIAPITLISKIFLLDKLSPFKEKWAIPIIVALTISFTCYWGSRIFKGKVGPILFALFPFGMLQGIILNVLFFIHFLSGNTLFGGIVPVLGFELWAPIPLILFYWVEFHRYHLSFQEKLRLGTYERSEKTNWFFRNLLNRTWWSNPWFYGLFLIFLVLQEGVFHLIYQRPDAALLAFSETCEYFFSKKAQCYRGNQGHDHSLVVVSLVGDQKWVKTKRMGIRKGEPIVVNRQLMIANAFEQWLEKQFPALAWGLRKCYDKIDLWLTRMSDRKWFANLHYGLMKPIEWFFLLWLYLFDPNPEQRIVSQYLPTEKEMERLEGLTKPPISEPHS